MNKDTITDLTMEEVDRLYKEDIKSFNALPSKVKILYRVSRINKILGNTSNDPIVKSMDILKEMSTKRS